VVWILLTGAAPDLLPEWWSAGDQASQLNADLSEWLTTLTTIVRLRFAEADWPGAQALNVLFDSAQRVQEGGGYAYFK